MNLPEGLTQVIASVAVVQPQPGDIIVVRTAQLLTSEAAERIKGYVEQIFPKGQRVVVLGEGMDLWVLRPEPGAEVIN